MLQPKEQRRHAEKVVRRLREAGFEAYWAGGCVRDQLLGRVPNDYDVATNALPRQVRELFSHRRTLAIGAAFGVIAVLGRRGAGTVEVTTFRQDAAYSDGRHPDSVTFSTAEEDASRRDFTINGLFYDPVERRVIDFVGGQADLAAGRVRAIGCARDRFTEDKLRMLRAVRFAATFDFTLDDECRAAIAEMATEIHVVSPERIAVEMRRLLSDAHRALGMRLFIETGLAEHVLPEIVPCDPAAQEQFEVTLEVLGRLGNECGFPLALAAMLAPFVDSARVETVCRRWRLSNKETDRACWLVANREALADAPTMRWSALQPLLVADGRSDLLRWVDARQPGCKAVVHCRRLLERPHSELNPPPLVTGDDLIALGIPAGPDYKRLLDCLRAAQLDDEIHTRDEALSMAEKLRAEGREKRGEKK